MHVTNLDVFCVCLWPDPGIQQQVEQESSTRREGGLFDAGINYFARKKACLTKKGRHLNDEVYQLYSSTGEIVPYQSLRHHSVEGPPDLSESTKARFASRHSRPVEPSNSTASG
ncbi:hypothetical protein ACOMHN_053219 [Nucella lapillus]